MLHNVCKVSNFTNLWISSSGLVTKDWCLRE